ncbi:hypothetical protein MLD38_003603 [Melastoma candidum]|uniref:Uncharacterized protein n=1 Tax=Melastoma candidum TaxID=119954 RepID=A0ACB9S6A1_9MYRT|nr:hypothetical protein MLD38_003603 [Melastoma candidum]
MHLSFLGALSLSFIVLSCCSPDPPLLPGSGTASLHHSNVAGNHHHRPESTRLYPYGRGFRSLYYKNRKSSDLLDTFTVRSLLDTVDSAAMTSLKIVNVNDYGAVGDGRDDSQAFERAWRVACAAGSAALVVPSGRTYNLKPVIFSGPCKPGLVFKVYGTIRAFDNTAYYAQDKAHWLMFENLNNFRVEGDGGSIDGNGQRWWQNSCKTNPKLPCRDAPTALTFHGCNNLRVTDLSVKNAQQMHLLFEDCTSVQAVNLSITAPEESPNTDGIHVSRTQNIAIQNCVIATGDDCISIVGGSSNVQATDITCGPGHGISIGSLGAGDSQDYVSDVLVTRATLSGTTNGVRIKTWQGGSGYAKSIKFQDIVMKNVANPIIIDQNYCDQKTKCQTQASAVQVSNVVYSDIRGTSASEEAIIFNCSKSHPCQGITLQDINLRTSTSSGNKAAEALCSNVNFIQSEGVFPQCSKITS